MRKISKKLYAVLAVVLCVGIAFAACITPSDASDGKTSKQVNQHDTAEEVKKTLRKDTVVEEVVNDSGKSIDKAQKSNTADKKEHETSKEKDEIKETVTHTHKWEPVYVQKKVEKIRQVAWTKCYACGADMTGNISHIDQHLLNHETNVHYGTEYKAEVYYETESYISGYKCSCGKTK